jgi:hypothetical protein
VRGYAYAQLGDIAGARLAFDSALELGRDASGFDELEALIGLTRLALLNGDRMADDTLATMASIIRDLGILAITYVPLPAVK